MTSRRLGFCRQKTETPQKHPSQTCKATRRSAWSKRNRMHLACGERGAGRLRLVILRRECSPNKGARGPAARPLVRRSPRTPRKAGDGGLTGEATPPPSQARPSPSAPAARAAPAALSSCSCHVGHTTTVHPLAIDSARCCRDRSTED